MVISDTNSQPPSSSVRRQLRVAVIGGGAGGFFSAVNIAEKFPWASVTIFEAAPSPLRKVAISGGGRCNLTHGCFEPARLVEFYPRGNRELRSVFSRFQPKDTMAWFEKRGLKQKIEPDGRVFPVTDNSADVIAVLRNAAHRSGVIVQTGTRVTAIRKVTGERNYFTVATASSDAQEKFDICILSTGYSPTGWALAAALGHTVLPPVPSLFPFTVRSPIIEGLQGIALSRVSGRLLSAKDGKKIGPVEEGAMLMTHTGLSGPLIYRLSARAARELAEANYQATIRLDLLPDVSLPDLQEYLQGLLKQDKTGKKLANHRLDPFPSRLWLALLAGAELDADQRADSISDKAITRLATLIKQLTLPVSGKSPSKEEFVSCGGVSRKEVDFKTMQSRLVPDLYFAGEVLDIDGLTGGFNFQACWSAGWVLSEALALP